MDRVGEIMERLGFDKEANEGVKAAFVKNLIKQAYGVEVTLPPRYQSQNQTPSLEKLSIIQEDEPQQLSFDLGDSPKVG